MQLNELAERAFGILVFPQVTLVLVFALMAVVLVVKPWGLLGRPDPVGGRATCAPSEAVIPLLDARGP